MDIPAFSGDGMGGSGRRRTSKHDMEAVSRPFCGEPTGPGPMGQSKRQSQPRRHCGKGNYNETRVASVDHRNDEPRRSGTIPCKLFASGNCHFGRFCRFSHNDQGTQGSFRNYKPDDRRQGTAFHGVDMERSNTCTGNQLTTLNETSRKPDVLDAVRSEAATSGQRVMSFEQFSNLKGSLARLLEDGYQLSEVYAALNALQAMGVASEGGKLANNEGDDKADEIKENTDGTSLRVFKFAIA